MADTDIENIEKSGYTIDETAKLCGISKDTVRRQIRRGSIAAFKTQGRYGEEWRIPNSEIYKLQKKTNVPEKVGLESIQSFHIEDMKDMIKSAMREVVSEEIEKGFSVMQAKQESLMLEHYARVDTLLRERCAMKEDKQKSIWKRLFG